MKEKEEREKEERKRKKEKRKKKERERKRRKRKAKRKKEQTRREGEEERRLRRTGAGRSSGQAPRRAAAEAVSSRPEMAWQQVPTGSDQVSTLLPSIQGADILQDLTCGLRLVKAVKMLFKLSH